MANKLSFYLHQSIKYINHSKLTIFALALAVSMVAGFGYYFDSAQKYTLEESYVNIFDFEADFHNNKQSWTIGDNNELETKNQFLDSKIDIEEGFFYREITSNYCFFKYNNTFNETIEEQPIWISSTDQFYKSDRLSQYIELIEGRFPEEPGEFLVESSLAEQYNISIGPEETFKFYIGDENVSVGIFDGIKITGLYSPYNKLQNFGDSFFTFGRNYIFTFNDFNDENQFYPFEDLILEMQNHTEFKDRTDNGISINTKMGFVFNRDSINIAWLRSSYDSINEEFQRTILYIPSSISTTNIISPIILSQFKFQQSIRLGIQFTNLPLYLFAIYMGSIANKTNIRKRYTEFFSMRMRGFPKSMVRNQLTVESLINSIIIGFLGIILGVAVFFLGQRWMNPMFLPEFNESGFILFPYITSTAIIETFVFSAIITLLSSISTIKFINNLKTSDLAAEISQSEGDIDYDETTLFINKNKNININKNKILESNKRDQEKLDINDFIKKKEDLIPKWGIPMVFLSLIPPFLFLIIKIGQSSATLDILIELSFILRSQLLVLTLLTFLSPFVFVTGILHYIIVESPPRFAKLTKFIARIFVKNRDYLVGIEMNRQKQYKRIIFLSGIFVSLLLFANMSTSSLTRQSELRNNYEVGSDINLRFFVAGQEFKNHSDLDNFQYQLDNTLDNNGNLLINDSTLVYTTTRNRGGIELIELYVNLSEYLPIIEGNNKPLPNKNFRNEILDVIEYNQDLSDDNVGLIVSSTYLKNHDLRLGETIRFDHYSTNFSSNKYIKKIIFGKILKVIDLMPGLYINENSENDFMIVDSHIFNYSSDIIPSQTVKELINLNNIKSNGINNYEEYMNNIENGISYNMYAKHVHYYNYNWRNENNLNSIDIPFLGLFYFNLIVIGIILSVGISIMVTAAQEENKGMYGELLARGFGRSKLYFMLSTQVLISFMISFTVGVIGGIATSYAFCKMFVLTLGGGFIDLPVFFNFSEFFFILGLVIGLTYLFLIISFVNNSKRQISEFLEEIE